MTALIYKATLPTYTSAEDLNANVGESLVLNDTGTAYELEPAQGGASVRTERARYLLASSPQSIPAVGGQGASPIWNPVPDWIEGTPQLDFANPETPTFIEAGIYAVSVVLRPETLAPGKSILLELDLDGNGHDPYLYSKIPLDAAAPPVPLDAMSAATSLSLTQYCPAGGMFYAFVQHDHTSVVAFHAWFLIQRVA